jgi:hypothetical protein
VIHFVALVVRLIIGALSVLASLLVLDQIHDRNTEIIVACIGLAYCFTYVISRRWQYYGLNAVSLFGMTVSWINAEPFDAGVRQQVNLPAKRSLAILSIFFAVIVELICAYRLLTSLIGHGWERLAAPAQALFDLPALQPLLTWFNHWI